jgi:CheY-like chemotaxis protein
MATVLIVDDSPIDRRLAEGLLKKGTDLLFRFVADGKEALDEIQQTPPDVVVTDLQMPEMNGMDLVRAVRAHFPEVPVILMTAHGSEEIAVQALSCGAASYVPKSRLANELRDTVETVLGAAHAERHHARLMACVTRNQWNFTLDNDPSLVMAVVDHMQQHVTRLQLFDETGRIRMALALEEALLNSLYHGNLEISSKLCELDLNAYYTLADERRRSGPYADRIVQVEATLSRDEAVFVIRDEGPGFDLSSLPDPRDPSNLERLSGRGLLLIHTFMDEVRHNAKGNEITMIKRRDD